MSLSLLFLKRTDKQGWFRNIITLVAIILATTVLLSAMAVGNAISNQSDRDDRLGRMVPLSSSSNNLKENLADNGDVVIFSITHLPLDRDSVREIGLLPASTRAPLLRGLHRYPAENEVFVSSALKKAIDSDEKWRERYADVQVIKAVPDFYLGSPDQKVAFYRISDQDYAKYYDSGTMKAIDERGINATEKSLAEFSRNRLRRRVMDVFMLMCGLGFSFPLLILAISATRVGIMQREQRYAALSLIGASKKQINQVILFETLITAGLGAAIGTGLYFLVNYLVLREIRFNSLRFFPQDLSIEPLIFVGIITLVLAVSVLVNWLALRKVKTSPLGVAKRQKRLKKPRIWRLLPILASVAWVYWVNQQSKDWFMKSAEASMFHFVGIFLLSMFSLLVAGPYLTYLLAKLLSKIGRGATTTLASKRLQAFAKPIYSSVSGVVLAFFVGTFFMSSLASVKASYQEFYKIQATYSRLSSKQVNGSSLRLNEMRRQTSENDIARLEALIKNHDQLQKSVLVIKPLYYVNSVAVGDEEAPEKGGYVYTCAELVDFTQLTCPDQFSVDEKVVVDLDFEKVEHRIMSFSDIENPRTHISSVLLKFSNPLEAQRAKIQIQNLISQELRRSGDLWYIQTDGDTFDVMSRVAGLVDVVLIGTALTVVIASLSLAVATISGFFERKRSFFALRLMGAGMSRLNRVILLEALVPLILASVLALSAGALLVKYLVSVMVMDYFIFKLPEARYFIVVALSFVSTFVIIALILPLLKRITNFENNRTE